MAVGKKFIAQSTVGEAEVLVYASQPRCHLIGRTAMVGSAMKGRTEAPECLVVVPCREIYFAQGAEGTGCLEEVGVLTEEGHRMMCHSRCKALADSEQAVGHPALVLAIEKAVGIRPLEHDFLGTKGVGDHGSERLQGIGFEVCEAIGLGHGIDAEQMVELRDSHFLGCPFDEAAAAHHIMIVKPLRGIGLQVDILGCILYLAAGSAVLTQIIIIGGSDDVELRDGIMQAVLLPRRKAALLGEDAPQTLLGTETIVEECFPLTDALHNLHGKHVGTKQFQLVATCAMNLSEQIQSLVVAHLLVADVGHIVERFGLSVGVLRREGTGCLGCLKGGGDIGIAQTIGQVVVPLCRHHCLLPD